MEKETKDISSESNTRRNFLKLSGAIGSSALLYSPFLAMAGKGESPLQKGERSSKDSESEIPDFNPELIGDGLNVLFKTYARMRPYQHKFNDALVKAHIGSVDFAVTNGIADKYVKHSINVMDAILQREKKMIEKTGKDEALNAMFEGTICSVQLYGQINIKKNERSFSCPYKEILAVCEPLNMFSVKRKDICSNYCVPYYTGMGKVMGVEVQMFPGDTCIVRV